MAEPHGTRDRILLRAGEALVLGVMACTARSPSAPTPTTAPVEAASPATFRREPDASSPPPISCATATGHRRLLTLDWTPAEHDALVKGRSRGLAVVRLVGCDLSLLPDCRVPAGRYLYTPRAPLEYPVTIEPDPAMWVVNLPRWAGERSPRPAAELRVELVTAGQYRAAPLDLRRATRVGECDGATHVISAVEVGAIRRASSTADTDCHHAHPSDPRPPPRCAIPWSVQLIALDPHAPLGPPCPVPLHWNGLYCGRDAGRRVSQTCAVAPPDHPACAPGWPEPPPEDARRALLPERLDATMIDAALAPVRDAFARCGARTGQPAGTRVQLHLRVDGPTGQVLAARAVGTQAHRPLGRCAVQAAATARFETTLAADQRVNPTLWTR